jgi:pyruvate dehydrogenase E1 component beta subunit
VAVVTFREAVAEVLREEMRRDSRIFLLGEDIVDYGGTYGVTRGFAEEFGEKRVKDTPIAESVIIGAAVGAAMGGLRPVAELMNINFAMQAMDQIVNSAAKVRYMFGGQAAAPVVIRTAGGSGVQLAATHSQNFEVYFAHMPGLKVAIPATPKDAKGLLTTCVRGEDPVLFVEHAALYGTRGEVPDGEFLIPLGQAEVKREGKDLTLISYSRMLLLVQEAASRLAKEGIEVEVLDLRSLRPLDVATIVASVRKTNRALVVEEDWHSFGVGAEVAARIQEEAFDYLDAPVKRVAVQEVPLPYAKNLEKLAIPNVDRIMAGVEQLLGR